MKLVEALAKRKDLLANLQTLSTRITESLVVLEGEEPEESTVELLATYDAVREELAKLIERINYTNLNTQSEDGTTITEMIAQRDMFAPQVAMLQAAIFHAKRNRRYREMRYVGGQQTEVGSALQISAADLQSRRDALAARVRALNNKIQALNYSADLIE